MARESAEGPHPRAPDLLGRHLATLEDKSLVTLGELSVKEQVGQATAHGCQASGFPGGSHVQLQGFSGAGQGHFQLVEEVVSPKRRTTYDGLKM